MTVTGARVADHERSAATARTAAQVALDYRDRAARLGTTLDDLRQRSSTIGLLRLATFFLVLAALIWLVAVKGRSPLAAEVVAVISALSFAILVTVHSRLRRREERLATIQECLLRGERRVNRDWQKLPDVPAPPGAGAHPYAEDLGIVGHASLSQLLDVTTAAPGRTSVMAWLLEPSAPVSEVQERQTAALELVAHDALREQLGALAILSGGTRAETLKRFLEWCESPPWLLSHAPFLWATRLLTAATIITGMLELFAVITTPIWLATATAGLLLMASQRKNLGESARVAGFRAAAPRAQAEMLRLLAAESFNAPLLRRLQARINAGGGAGEQLAVLEHRLSWAEVRYSPLLYAVLQWLFQWDVHVVERLERWRRDAGRHARDWLVALGEAEALAAFATLAHDNPGWVFPEITEQTTPIIVARDLAHPLLTESERVANNVTIGPPETFLLVTGSNMSGKSTLLRSIGANVVLAGAGAPVCASAFVAPLLAVRTSIRISDSLESGISLFMAELRRLKTIVDDARALPNGHPVLYLLDEILHGTNTAERRIAARIVIGHLLRAGAIGAVTTHDLSLASDEDLRGAAQTVHFTEHFDRDSSGRSVMNFDYRLRSGLATSVNALALLEMVGLGDEPERPPVR